ncbi:MAG: hypothetical protein KatS3mg001_518 [Candidatus Pacearchaeota archaeon]|nr:MAG: hypothetical protein KatS3mg001_518 [Candidatus Pacearchaeota archaeon]
MKIKKKYKGLGIKKNKKAQVWVETMVYTLIALTLIGIVLAFVKPKIEESQDRSIIEQSIGILEDFDSLVNSIGTVGNQRVFTISIRKGSFIVDSLNDVLSFKVDSKNKYSEIGEEISVGNIMVQTLQKGKNYEVILARNFSSQYNVTFNGLEQVREMTPASVPYRILVKNTGTDNQGKIIIDIKIIS